jgi:hypothetical protein
MVPSSTPPPGVTSQAVNWSRDDMQKDDKILGVFLCKKDVILFMDVLTFGQEAFCYLLAADPHLATIYRTSLHLFILKINILV